MKKIGKLNCHTIQSESGSQSSNTNCVVLFHGYGADAMDLAPLAEMFGVKGKVDFVFPEGPIGVAIGPSMSGRAWFDIDAARLENAMRNGQTVDLSKTKPKGIESASALASELVGILRAQYKKLVIGGFSQGAMLTTDVTLRAKEKPDGLIIMSGTLVNEEEWTPMIKAASEVPFFQSHGRNDAILGYQYAENLYSLLSDKGMYGQFHQFPGGHEIPPKIISEIGKFINSICR